MKSKLLFLPDVFFVFLIVFSCEPTKMKDYNNPVFNEAKIKNLAKKVDQKGFLSHQFLKDGGFYLEFYRFTDKGVEKLKFVKEIVSKE